MKKKKDFVSKFDIFGSYTGNVKDFNKEEQPVQDADDL